MQQKLRYLEYGGGMTTEEVLGELERQPQLTQLRRELNPDRRFYLLYGNSEEQLLWERGLRLSRGVKPAELLRKIQHVRGDAENTALHKVVAYAACAVPDRMWR